MKAMLVDDSVTMRRIQRNVLEKLGGIDIVEANDGKEAFEKLTASPVDLIVLDMNMPNMDGMTFLRMVRSMSQYKDLQIIMCTSESEKSKIVEAIKAGANNYMVKPFSPEVMEQKLKDMKLL